ncbi:7tm Chemosensory receptor [Popillia japonica]|uniref:Gustatory receptor n=1 Tax=Popillia japonica TaxID=7064 RepID=A0AAW1KHU8_POPJA
MSVVISCALVLFHPKKHRKILKNIQELNRLLSYNFPKIDKKKKTIIRLAALHVCFSIAYFLDYYLWVARKSLTIYKYFGFDHILRYRFIIFAHYMANVVRELNYGAKYMNKILKCANKRFGKNAAKKHNLLGIIHNDVATALKAHTMIADGICCYNKIFGWTFVLMHIDSLITFLMYFQLSLKINTEQLDLIRSIFLTWMVLMMIFSVMGAISMVYNCYATTRALKKAGTLAYSLLYTLELKRYKEEQNLLMENLHLLIRQSTLRSPSFSAAGFFIIDYSTLFTLLNLLTSYIIVLIQFK